MKRQVGKFQKGRRGAIIYIGSGIIKDESFCLDLDNPIIIENVNGGLYIYQDEREGLLVYQDHEVISQSSTSTARNGK